MQSPEQRAREKIDNFLTDRAWIKQNRSPINVTVAA
jgi:hypothetical protein